MRQVEMFGSPPVQAEPQRPPDILPVMVKPKKTGWSGFAVFSQDMRFRYELHREWSDGDGMALVVMLNPSTADAEENDPTVARVCSFVRASNARKLCVTNLFAYQSPYPDQLAKEAREGRDVVGPDNDEAIARLAADARFILVAWGSCAAAPRLARDRARALCTGDGVLAGRELLALRVTKAGAPEHPLYLPGSLQPALYPPNELERWMRGGK